MRRFAVVESSTRKSGPDGQLDRLVAATVRAAVRLARDQVCLAEVLSDRVVWLVSDVPECRACVPMIDG
jgi:hypothetical protein